MGARRDEGPDDPHPAPAGTALIASAPRPEQPPALTVAPGPVLTADEVAAPDRASESFA